MRLVSFEKNNEERWGFVINHPIENRDWVFEPGKTGSYLQVTNRNASSGWLNAMDKFRTEWPATIQDFLNEGPDAMAELKKMAQFVPDFLLRGDRVLIEHGGCPLETVHLRCPVPRPRLMFGLVQNSPSFWRHNPNRRDINLYPMGHQRSFGSVVGHGETFLRAANYNVELGVVIGKEGRDIPITEAIKHIAGYTVVIDSEIKELYPEYLPSWTPSCDIEKEIDWYVAAAASWCGKKVDAHCVVGPWISTPDEVGNPYDLLVYTLQNGQLRDRSHTAATSISVEGAVHWMSTFMTLKPGDIIHMGTMGTDGLACLPEDFVTRDANIGSEIENIGRVEARVLHPTGVDWRTEEEKHPNADYAPRDEAIRDSIVPAVRDYLRMGKESIDSYDPALTNHVWTCYGNYEQAEAIEGMRKTPIPRFLNGPSAALGYEAKQIQLAKRATSLDAGVEMAFVIGRLASGVKAADADDYILGYAPVVSVSDHSFADRVVEPCTQQEKHLPTIYARWGEGYQVTGPWKKEAPDWNAAMKISIPGVGEAEGCLSEYVHKPAEIVEAISKYITLFPGDVVLMGRVSGRIDVAREQADGLTIQASVAGYDELNVEVRRS